jgi:outer membrane protein assembly factor BamA
MKIKFFLFYFIFIYCWSVSAQTNDTINFTRVDSISITGNKITEEDIILRELTFEIGDSLDAKTLEYNRERIYSLGIFNQVYLVTDSINYNHLRIIVEESWYIYPLPYTELKDRDWKKFSYGMDFIIRNFRGRNETLHARAAFGYDPSYYLFYSSPYLLKEQNIFFSSSLSYRNVRNRSITAANLYGSDFDQRIITGEIGVGKRFLLFHRAAVSFFYQYIANPVYLPGFTASGDRIDRVPGIGLGYSYDTRDLVQFPSDGIYANVNLLLKGLGDRGVNYQIYNFDYREFRKIYKLLNVKWRFASRVSGGKLVPYYDYSFLGLGERVRGHIDDRIEGHNSYVASLEFYYPIISEMNVNLDFVPLIPAELLHYRVALYTQIFGDAGGVKTKGLPFRMKDIQSGYGGGITLLILPYNILRFEYALDEYKNGEFIFDLGISF